MLEKEQFKVELERNLKQRLAQDHPIIEELFLKKDRELLNLVTLQGYQLTKVFAIYVGGLYYRCPIAYHRKKFAYNVFEEETGAMSKTNGHLELLDKFLEAIGLTKEDIDAVVLNPETKDLIDYRFNLIEDPATFHKAVAAVMIASEGQNLEDRVGTLKRDIITSGFGLKEDDVLFFKVHAQEDVFHVQDGINATADVCYTKQMQDEAIEAIHITCDKFWNFYEGISKLYKSSKIQIV